MLTRRDFLQVAAATAAVTGLGGRLGRAAAQQAIGQDQLLQFAPKGQLTILHMADCHAQLKPLYYREPSLNLGVGEARGGCRTSPAPSCSTPSASWSGRRTPTC